MTEPPPQQPQQKEEKKAKEHHPPAAKDKNQSAGGNQRQGGKERQQGEKRQTRPAYRLQNRKEIEINRRHQDFPGRAELMKQIGFALFGNRRFRRIELTCSLNNFYTALRTCSIFHRGVAGLFLIVDLEKVFYTQFQEETDEKGVEKEHSLFRITLTRFPTENDRKSAGFNAAFKAEEIKTPFKMPERRRRGNRNRKEERRGRNQDRDNRQREDNRQRRDRKAHRRQKDEHFDRPKYVSKKSEEAAKEQNEQNRSKYRLREKDDKGKQSTKKQQKREADKDDNRKGDRQKKDAGNDGGRQYARGEKRSRGQGKVSQHHYESIHMRDEGKRTQDRGERAPPRKKNRYTIDQEDW